MNDDLPHFDNYAIIKKEKIEKRESDSMDYSEMQMKLKQFLLPKKTITDKREFVDGILSLVSHPDDLKEMCDWIDECPDANESEIICKALELNIPRTEPERIIR
jgi:hypothetical protein